MGSDDFKIAQPQESLCAKEEAKPPQKGLV